jgi:hypothetical protein
MLMRLVTIDWIADNGHETLGSCAGHSEITTISVSLKGGFQPRMEGSARDRLHG